MKKFISGLILGAIISGAIVGKINKPKSTMGTEESVNVTKETQDEFAKRAAEISAMKEGPDRVAKLDQLLGEMLKAMMISVKLRMDTASCGLPGAAPVAGVASADASGPSAATAANQSSADNSGSAIAATSSTSTAAADNSNQGKLTTTVVDTKALAKKINNTTDIVHALNLLKNHPSPNLEADLGHAHKVKPDDLQYLLGRFEGELKYNDNKKPSSGVVVEMKMQSNNKDDLAYDISLSKNGKVFDRSSGKGAAKNFMSNGSQGPIYIEYGGGDSQFEIYYIPALDAWVGNAYRSKSRGQWEFEGQVNLSRN